MVRHLILSLESKLEVNMLILLLVSYVFTSTRGLLILYKFLRLEAYWILPIVFILLVFLPKIETKKSTVINKLALS